MTSITIIYIILSGIIALFLALFQYAYKSKYTKTNAVLAGLRFITIFSILLLLINPKLDSETFYNEKPNLVVAIDDSNSLDFLEQSDSVRILVNALKNNSDLNKKFNIDFYKFSDDISLYDSLEFSTKQTNIDKALKGLQAIYKNTVAPTILITDGNQTYGNDYEYAAKSYKQPIYPIVLGDTTNHIDLKINQLNVNKYAFYKNKFPVEVILVYNGEAAVTSEFKITSGNSTVYSERVSLSKSNNSKIIQVTLSANQIGLFTYKASIQPLANEKNIINNYKNFAIEVIDEQTNIAIVSDILHPDLGTLKKSIESNEQCSISILKPSEYLAKINDFQLAILYQPNASFKSVIDKLNTDNLNRFVIAGTQTSWNFLNSVSTNYQHDLISQTENYLAEENNNYTEFIIPDINFDDFPPLSGQFGNINVKVSFQILLYKQIGSITTDKPLLLTLDNNNRREALLLGENIWKWRAQSYIGTNSFNNFDDFFGKMVQYLASKKRRERLSLEYESFYDGNTNILLQAQYFNKNYEFDNRETLTIMVTDEVSKETKTIPLVLKNANYEVDLSSLPASDYQFTVKANSNNISKSGRFKILAYNIEEQFSNANASKLQKLATDSQGQTYFNIQITDLTNHLLTDNRYTSIQRATKKTVSLIDWKYLLGLLVLSLSAEWFYRKYKGLI
ncbi:VWA domain-containing protein [Bizionia argentinensis JUB59]|uniref:VWA domain-containing protein n=1 Tax=Bizionia argentinensis JUB59 TaxID=1046627 RepID=G2E9D5_9FLAO|nr:VWA domain-containing protein [Bizionia argentinensis]EGV45039.1 VWA domain-containing protein [Bizionia argentinensis JUB59]